jgi:hypothetical protein
MLGRENKILLPSPVFTLSREAFKIVSMSAELRFGSNPPGKPPLTGPPTKLPIGVVGVGGIDEAIGDCIGRISIFTRKSSAPFCKEKYLVKKKNSMIIMHRKE